MSKKKNILQLGNFAISKDCGGGHDWLCVKAVNGFWTLRFRDDNLMYARLKMLIEEKTLHEYLSTYITTVYLISNTTPDIDYFNDFFKSYSAMAERNKKLAKQATQEEDEKIINDMQTIQEIKENIATIEKSSSDV